MLCAADGRANVARHDEGTFCPRHLHMVWFFRPCPLVLCTLPQLAVLKANYAQEDPAKVETVKALYRELKLPEVR